MRKYGREIVVQDRHNEGHTLIIPLRKNGSVGAVWKCTGHEVMAKASLTVLGKFLRKEGTEKLCVCLHAAAVLDDLRERQKFLQYLLDHWAGTGYLHVRSRGRILRPEAATTILKHAIVLAPTLVAPNGPIVWRRVR